MIMKDSDLTLCKIDSLIKEFKTKKTEKLEFAIPVLTGRKIKDILNKYKIQTIIIPPSLEYVKKIIMIRNYTFLC